MANLHGANYSTLAIVKLIHNHITIHPNSAVMELARPLSCLIIQHNINDPDVMEHYLSSDAASTEACLPIALRDVLNEYAVPAGLAPMKIPDASTLSKYLTALWEEPDDYEGLLDLILHESELNLIYLLPYILMRNDVPNFRQNEFMLPSVLTEAFDADMPFYYNVLRLLTLLRSMMYMATDNPERAISVVKILLEAKPDKNDVSDAYTAAVSAAYLHGFNKEITQLVCRYVRGT